MTHKHWSSTGLLLVAACAVALSTPSSAVAQAGWLVTPEEVEASRKTPMPLPTRTVPPPGAPRLQLIAPDLTSAVSSPTRIQVRFEATSPAAIRPNSFRVRYGALRLDITSRILASTNISEQGIDVVEARIPKGSHRLWLEIQDTEGRTGTRQLDFTVL